MKALNRINTKTPEFRPIRVLQLGGGNFLRGFFDWMVDVLNENTSFNGDVVLIKPTSGGNYKELIDQEGLFHTILQDHSGEVTRRIDCIQKVIHPYLDWQSFLDTASLPFCRFVVSNTTESGIIYQYEPLNPGQPQNSFPAKLTVWLFERFKSFNADQSKGVIVLPTELIEKNGQKLREAVLSHAIDWELGIDFNTWIETSNNFCNTLVDRIVSGFPMKSATKIQHSIGFNDTQLVVGENYHQWVIESTWDLKDEIPFEQTNLNVSLVENLSAYREIKVRILNGAHTALVPIGMLSGLTTVYEVMKDQYLGSFVKDLIEMEIIPTFSDATTIDAASFAKSTILRFENPYINHQLKSISLHAFQKFQVRLIPSILLYLERFKTYPARIMFCWAALIYEETGDSMNLDFLDDWDLMGLNKHDVIDQLRVHLKGIHQLGISKSIKLHQGKVRPSFG